MNLLPAEQTILDTVHTIEPFDNLERQHKDNVVSWIYSGVPLFRISKPDNPSKHLVSYFVLYDAQNAQVMLIHHIKAGLWLPTGGHIELGEDPQQTVVREADEELGITAIFDTEFGDDPFFVTVTETIGKGSHTDVSLWYVINGNCAEKLDYDKREMNGYKWLSLDAILATDSRKLDPHMHRFIKKMLSHLRLGSPT